MTAEIVILNRSAVALAADSAATIGSKIYNSVNKIFPLSLTSPVGIMIYNASTFMSIPWETIIKTYRKQLGDTCFNYVQDYCEDFIAYLRSGIVPVALQQNRLSYTVVTLFQHYLINYENSEQHLDNKKMITDYIKECLDEVAQDKLLPDCSSEDLLLFVIENSDLLNETINIVFNGYQLTEEDNNNLKEIVSIYMHTENFMFEEYTGIVITGFGEDEIFPSLYSYNVGLLNGVHLKIQKDKEILIDGISINSSVIPFAQQDVVYRYLLGLDPELHQFSRNYLFELLQNYNEMVEQQFDIVDDEDFLNDLKIKAVEAFDEGISEYQKESYINPMHEIIMNLPNDELGSFAEKLVSLSSFKKKVTKEQETVGGPIDVAIITKGDGLIWLKRKHYFEASINHQFFKR